MAEETQGPQRSRAGEAWLAVSKDVDSTRERFGVLRAAVKELGAFFKPDAWKTALDLMNDYMNEQQSEELSPAESKELTQSQADLRDAIKAYQEGQREELDRLRERYGHVADAAQQLPEMLEAAMPFSPPNVLIIEIQPEPASPTEKPAPPAKERPKKKRKREPTPLTAKQRMALELWAENRTNITKVAEAMGIDRKTAKQHLSYAFKKLGAAETRIFKEHIRKREQYRDLPHDKRGQVLLEGERVWPKPEVLVEDSDATGADEENSDEGKNEPQPGDEDFDENFDDEEDDSEDEE